MKPSSALRRFLCIASSATSPTGRLAFLAFAASPLLPFGTAGAQTAYTWNGTTNGTYATTTNWTSGSVAPTTGTTNSRLNVNNTDPTRPLTFSGSPIYSGNTGGSRALVIGSGTNGNMVITGGTFDSRQLAEDVIGNNGFAGSLTINGGNYINTNDANPNSDTFLMGLNGAATPGTAATLNVESGNFTAGRIQFGQDSGIGVGGIVSVVNLNGGILSTKQFHEQASLGNFGVTGLTTINSTVNFNGGTLRAIESGTIMKVNAVDNAVVQSGGAIIDTNNFNTTIAKALTAGTGSGGLTKQGAGILTLSSANTYTGGTTLNQGTLTVGTGGTLGAATGALSVNNTNSTAAGTDAVLNLATAVDTTVGSLSGTIATPTSGTNTASINTQTSRNFTVNQTADGTYAGVIAGAGAFTLGSSSTHTLTLTGANTYSGGTNVSGGKLVIGGSIGASAVTVSNAGTILATDAAASFGSTVTVQNGAILAPGDAGAAGTATVTGATTFDNGSIFSWDISANGTAYDKIVAPSLAGEPAAGDAVFRVVVADNTFADSFWNTTKTWTDIFTTDGSAAILNWADLFTVSVVNSDFSPLTLPGAASFTISGNTLTWTAIPEPTSALAGLLLTAGLLRRRRK